MSNPDPSNLERFVEAQSPIWEQVLAELAGGRPGGRGHDSAAWGNVNSCSRLPIG